MSDDADAGNKRSPKLTRRRLLRSAIGLGVAATGLGGYAALIEPYWVHVAAVDMPLPNLPESWVGRRIVQISDMHVGPSDEDHLRHWLSEIKTLRADMVLLTGDFMSCHEDERIDATIDVVKSMWRPPLGAYAVLGNHDYGHGATFWRGWVGDTLARRLQDEIGVHVLRNEAVEVDGLMLAGIDDYWQKRKYEPRPVVEAVNGTDKPAIVMVHNPDACDDSVWRRRDGGSHDAWFVSGHTHGGQCKLPFMEPPMIPVKNKRYVRGEYDLYDGRRLYVNPGLGSLKHVRFCVRPEITVFTVRRA